MVDTPLSPVARFIHATTFAGPAVSSTAAAATVARLRRAASWSAPLLAELSGLPDAAHAVTSRPPLVVDRRGLVRVLDSMLATALGERPRPLSLLPSGMTIRTLALRGKGIWDPYSRRRILVAPNVLAACERFALDQADYCRWVALRAGLWGTHLEHAPHLVDELASTGARLAHDPGAFVRLVLLLDALPTIQMEALTPREIPAVEWIRRHRLEPAGTSGVRALSLLRSPEAGALPEAAQVFARTVLEARALEVLLSGVDALPDREEFLDPRAWLARVGA